jgi:hypothetical protein
MRILTLSAAAWLAATGLASAQEPSRRPLTRADTHFVIGWQNLNKEQPGPEAFDNWVNGIFYGGAGAGWYWNDHLKTQVDVGAGTEGRQYRYEPIVTNGQTTSTSSLFHVRQTSVALSQQYQFFRNQWFHPHVGAGVDIGRETTTEEYSAIFVFDSVARTSRQLAPPRNEGPEHRTIARPFGEVGFKAYMTRRAFFTADTRLMYRKGLDEVLFRLGFGIDF